MGEVTDYNYLTYGDCIEVDNIDDAKEFGETQYALTLLGVGSKQQSLILRVLAAILHLGNVTLEDSGSDTTKIDPAEKSLGFACELLGVDTKQLAQWLGHRRIQTVTDVFDKFRVTNWMIFNSSFCTHQLLHPPVICILSFQAISFSGVRMQ